MGAVGANVFLKHAILRASRHPISGFCGLQGDWETTDGQLKLPTWSMHLLELCMYCCVNVAMSQAFY